MRYVALGAMSLDDVASSFGDSALNILRRKAQNIADAKQIAEEYGVDSYRELFNQVNTSAQANWAELLEMPPRPKPPESEPIEEPTDQNQND